MLFRSRFGVAASTNVVTLPVASASTHTVSALGTGTSAVVRPVAADTTSSGRGGANRTSPSACSRYRSSIPGCVMDLMPL